MKTYKEIPEEYRCKNRFCEIFSHWLNPLGNWLEPRPYPEPRAEESRKSILPEFIYWNFWRNPFTNFTHFWIGIVPIGPRYCWIYPEENGWIRVVNGRVSWWKKPGKFSLPYYRYDGKITFYIGWTSRGNFGLGLRKNIG